MSDEDFTTAEWHEMAEARLTKIEQGQLLNRYLTTAYTAFTQVMLKYLPPSAWPEIQTIQDQMNEPNAERDEILEKYMAAHMKLGGKSLEEEELC